MKKSTTGIYKITNTITNKFYIGSSININRRFTDHKKQLRCNKHKNQHLQNAWNEHGEDNFKFEIIELSNDDNLIKLEQDYLDNLMPWNNEIGYNIVKTAGNTFGYKYNEDSKVKISKSKINQNKINEYIVSTKKITSQYQEFTKDLSKKDIDIKNPFYNKTHTDLSKSKMRNSKLGNKNPHFGKGPMLGRKATDEHKAKIGNSNSGKNNKKSKPVLQLNLAGETIMEWDSAGIAARHLKLSVGNIWMCCNGKARTAYGFIWQYKNNIK